MADADLPIDIILTRENLAGLYQGEWQSGVSDDGLRWAKHTFGYSEETVMPFLTASAKLAAARSGKLTIIWKESGVPSISELWKSCSDQVADLHGIESRRRKPEF